MYRILKQLHFALFLQLGDVNWMIEVRLTKATLFRHEFGQQHKVNTVTVTVYITYYRYVSSSIEIVQLTLSVILIRHKQTPLYVVVDLNAYKILNVL